MPAGRPTKYKKEYCDMIVEHMAQGLSKESFAGAIGVDEKTIYNWEKEHKPFFQSVKKGEAASKFFWEKLGLSGVNGDIEGFNATTWIFNMKNRFRWTDKQEITGPSGGPIKTETKVLTVVGVKGGKDAGSDS